VIYESYSVYFKVSELNEDSLPVPGCCNQTKILGEDNSLMQNNFYPIDYYVRNK